jgi:ferritin
MISDIVIQTLNKQIEREAHASYLYLSMAGWCERMSLSGCASFLFEQSAEEHSHMMRIFHYILDMDKIAISPIVQKTQTEFESIQSLFEQIYKHEIGISKNINDLMNLAMKNNDHSTTNFLQWYVQEQREEESLMRSILDKIKLIGNGPSHLYHIDNEVAKMTSKTNSGTEV